MFKLPRIVKISTKSTWMIIPTAKIPASNFSTIDFTRIKIGYVILFTFCAQTTRLPRNSITLPCTYASFVHVKGVAYHSESLSFIDLI